MATALAASITCSTSPCVTSLSRTPTTPWELRLRTWLPAMPANTEWISQPAISSASSTARWMDCTVDSMLTTTPFFSPREGCEPSPRSSIEPSGATSPTSATTLEVPMSSPTIRFLSARLSIVATVPARGAGGIAAPADGKPVCVAHIDVGHVLAALRDELQRGVHEFLEALVHLAPSQTHGDAVGKIEFPGAASIEAHCGKAQARLRETSFRGQIALRHQRLLAVGAGELRQLRRNVTLVGVEQLTTGVEEPALAPAGRGGLLDDQHVQAPGPGALHAHRIHPRQRVDGAAHRREVDRQQARAVHLLFHDPLDVHRRHALEAPFHGHRLDGLIECPRHRAHRRRDRRQRAHPQAEVAPVDHRQVQTVLGGFATVFGAAEHGCYTARCGLGAGRRVKLLSSTRHTSSSKSTSIARAAMGTRL